MNRLIDQQQEDEARGLNILRAQLQMDTSRRIEYENQLNQPLTVAEQQLLANPPHYSAQDIQEDAKAMKYKCPIIQAIPELNDIVKWHGHYYSGAALQDFQSRPLNPTTDGSTPTRRNPYTNAPLTEEQFKLKGSPLSVQHLSRISIIISDYDSRAFRRNEWEEYKALLTRLGNNRTVLQGRQTTRAAVGNLQASPIDNYLTRQQQNNSATLAIMGQNARESEGISTPIRQEAIFQDTSPGTPPNFPSLLGQQQDVDNSNDTQVTNTSQNQNRVRTTYGSRRSSNANTRRRNSTNQREANPLRQQQPVLPPLPMNMWNDSRAEQAMKDFLQLAKDAGWENSLYRNRGNWCKDVNEDVFREGGCFYGYRKCAAIGLQDRLRNITRRHAELANNHNNDTTGAEGEVTYLWSNLFEEYLQWKESHTTTNQAQQTRQAMRTVQNALGAVQPPLGAGNPPQRSEVATENAPTLAGPQEVAGQVEVRPVAVANVTQPSVRPQMQPRSSRGRRRSNNNPSGTQCSNRQRTDRGNTIQDHIDQGREHLDTITGHLGVLTQSFVNSNQSSTTNPWNQDPVGNARQLTDSMITIAAGLGSPQAREAQERSLWFLNGIMNQAAGSMGFNMLSTATSSTSITSGTTFAEDSDVDSSS